ncbi:MAG: hypothetical protein H0U85_10370 [Gemmatimonadales bacterium]|nr:hypothetical protein [Gemmatimonadales bacterium]
MANDRADELRRVLADAVKEVATIPLSQRDDRIVREIERLKRTSRSMLERECVEAAANDPDTPWRAVVEPAKIASRTRITVERWTRVAESRRS